MKADHWDPKEHERTYYRSMSSGELGWMVRREGVDCIKLDRPAQEIVQRYDPAKWAPEAAHRPLTKYQLAQIAFEADKRLCFFTGRHDLARREWLSMKEEDRIRFTQLGPGLGPGRRELFKAVMAALERFAQ